MEILLNVHLIKEEYYGTANDETHQKRIRA